MLKVVLDAGTSGRYTTQLRDELDQPVPASALLSATLTVYDALSGDIINGWDHRNVLNANGVSIDSSGNLAWAFTPDDMPIVNTAAITEDHYALFLFGWGVSPVKGFPLRVLFRVNNVWRRP